MWIAGVLIGALVGAMGGGAGAIAGAVLGGLAGWLISDSNERAIQRYARLDAVIRQLNERVRTLEERAFTSNEPESAPRAEVRETRQPIAEPLAPAPDVSAATAAASVASIVSEPPSAPEIRPAAAQPRVTARESFSPRPESVSREPSALWNFFFGGNALVRIGVIVLFFGVSFLLKYTSEHIEIPIEARLIAVALGGVALLVIGWRLRRSRPGYALIVQGGGIGVLYLTVFAAFRLYQVLPGGLAFALLAAMAVLSALLAVLEDSPALAAMGVSGGFLAPILTSTGGGSHVALFSFYALLNLGILVVAWFKAWRSLNLLGFAFTFVIGLLWGARYYRPEFFASTEPFLILFFLFYVAIAVLFALRQAATIESPLDGALVFGVPLVGFGLQVALVRDTEYATAFSALALSAFYFLLAKVLFGRVGQNLRLLVESFLALAVVFGTLAIPLAFDGRWTAAAWAVEGAAIVWVGVRQNKILARVFGLFLQYAAGAAFFLVKSEPRGATPVLNSFYLGCVMIGVSSLFCSWILKRRRSSEEEAVGAVALFCWGAAWWFGGALVEIHEHVAPAYHLRAALLFTTACCGAFSLLHRRLEWEEAKSAALALLPLMYAAAAVETDRAAHPFQNFGFFVWPLAFGVHLWLLRRHEETAHIGWWHAGGLWLFAALGAWELGWWIGDSVAGGDVWRRVGWPLAPIALLIVLSDRGERIAWPVARHREAYLYRGGILLAGFLWLWMLYINFDSRGDPAPLPYWPLLNPLDLTQAAALLALFAWLDRMRAARFAPEAFRAAEFSYAALGSSAFIWLNGALLRTLHHWAGVPFDFDAMMRSMVVQASLSIFWSVLALCLMVTATRIRMRTLWLTGAGLMAVVVGKLFFIDLSSVSGIERIVSFIGVGVLMLVVGYFSPVPPATAQVEQ